MDQSKLPSRHDLALRLYLSHMSGVIFTSDPSVDPPQADRISRIQQQGASPPVARSQSECFRLRTSALCEDLDFCLSDKNNSCFPTTISICKSKFTNTLKIIMCKNEKLFSHTNANDSTGCILLAVSEISRFENLDVVAMMQPLLSV